MKILITCPRCAQSGVPQKRYSVSYQDSGRYVVPCEQGHNDVQVLRQQKFEILFEIGGNAILDGYFREAVSSFASSMERTFEFFLKVVFFQEKRHEEIEQVWKLMSKQSERQLGAFVSIHSLVTGLLPKLLSNKDIEFRNEVIHKGKVPTREEAVAFGQSVLDVIRPIVQIAREKFPDGVVLTMIQHDQNCRRLEDPKDLYSGFNDITILNLTVTGKEWHERTLERALQDLAQIRSIKLT